MNVTLKVAARELRGGLKGFWIFLLCLAFGVAAIAAVGSVREAIEQGLESEANTILGGDASMEFTYRYADDAERAWMAQNASVVSEIVDFRSMVLVGQERGLVQVKGVDDVYPLYGELVLDTGEDLQAALNIANGMAGLVAEKALIDRMELKVGDTVRLGTKDFQLRGAILKEPDAATAGFSFGPRVIVSTDSLQDSGLLAAGSLFNSNYRMLLPEGTDAASLRSVAETNFKDSGMQWSDASNGTPGLSRFVERMGAFLVIVGLAGLAVGGVGVSAAVRAYLETKKATIATLKTLGATRNMIFAIYLMQITALAVVGVTAGLLMGGGIPALLGPMFAQTLPVPAHFGIYSGPLIEAAIYGMLTALIFTIWPLARAVDIRAAGLFRDEADATRHWPRWYYILGVATLVALLIGLAAWFSGIPTLALWSAFGVLLALGALALSAHGTKRLAGRLSRAKFARGRPTLRLALGSVGGPGGEAVSVILSLGLGLSVLATVGQIDSNMRSAITEELPEIAPAYFFVDIQNAQRDGFVEIANADSGILGVETAPMLRGIITRVNGQPAKEVFGDHWALNGDRGITYSATLPSETVLTEGEWWAQDYSGPPIMSFSAPEAEELGLKLGDEITFNLLGRDITSEIVNFRAVDFADMGINFLMVLNPSALESAPHTHIATVYAEPEAEAGLLRDLANEYPNITAIRVRDAIERVSVALRGIASATRWGAAATLLTGLVVLIGAAAAGEKRRVYEAAILKTLGATRGRILASFALRSIILGAAAGVVAILTGAIAGWAVMTNVMEVDFNFDYVSGFGIVAGGALASLLAGLAFALRPLSTRPAQVLRSSE